jgi:pimeloyl-ACP methyl ester carboxylesterase
MKIPGKLLVSFLLINIFTGAFSQKTGYPYPVHYFSLNQDGQPIQIAFMDVHPAKQNGRSVLLFHGKNFNGFYWKSVIDALSKEGYRVIVPDQVGWGKSSKPNMKYSFKILAGNNISLLDSLGIKKTDVIGHSMGGMLATRFTLLYPEIVDKLILEDPLGLEDYKQFIPLQPIETLYKKELKGNYASYKKYMQSYFPVWKPGYEILVKVQAEALHQKDFSGIAYVNALTWQMIYDQPVLYELKDLKAPVLIIVGDKDRTILGKDLLTKAQQAAHGNFPELAARAAASMKKGKVIVIPGVGHIPHIQTPEIFNKDVIDFLH